MLALCWCAGMAVVRMVFWRMVISDSSGQALLLSGQNGRNRKILIRTILHDLSDHNTLMCKVGS